VLPVCMHALACTQLCAVFHTRPVQLQLLGSERVALARRAQGTAHKGENDIRRHVRLAVGVAGAPGKSEHSHGMHLAGHKSCAGALTRNLPCARRARGAGRGRAQDHGVHPPSQARARLPAQRPALHVRAAPTCRLCGWGGRGRQWHCSWPTGLCPSMLAARCTSSCEQSNGYFAHHMTARRLYYWRPHALQPALPARLATVKCLTQYENFSVFLVCFRRCRV